LKRSALILLVAGIVAVLIFLATRTPRSPASLEAPQTWAEVVESRSEPVALSPGEQRAAITPAADPLGWRVRVLDGGTQVAGATVSVVDWTAFNRALAQSGAGSHTIAGLELRRQMTLDARTGADGCAAFSTLPVPALVEARLGSNWAFTLVSTTPVDRCVTLTLAADRTLLARVVDADGKPVGGVPVALRRELPAQGLSDLTWTDTQPATGLATFAHFQRRLDKGSICHVLLAFPVHAQQQILVDAETPAEPPPTLLLPQTGQVLVRLRNSDGSVPDLEGIEVHLEASEHGAPLWPDGPWSRAHLDASGEARVSWIGLGLELKVVVLQEGVELESKSLAGPVRAGEEALCAFALERRPPAPVRGRFVLGDGRAWPAAQVRMSPKCFPPKAVQPRSREVRVGADGRFEVPVQETRPANGTLALYVFAHHPDGSGNLTLEIPIERDVPPEGLDLGDVLLDYGELLVSGQVFDSQHRPLKDAHFIVFTSAAQSHGEYSLLVRSVGTALTPADGRFALYLEPGELRPTDELRLSTHAIGYVTDERRPIQRGEQNVEVTLASGGGLAGSIELDTGLAPGDVEISLSSHPPETLALQRDSSFETSGLQPGSYSLSVRKRGADGRFEDEPAALVQGLVVQAGETCRDARIQGLRIGSTLACVRIRVLDRSAKPLRGAAVTIQGKGNERQPLSGDDGVCIVRSASFPVDLEVSAFGYLRQQLANVSVDQEVVLEAGYPIRLHTSTRPGGSKPQYTLNLHLFRVDENGRFNGPAWGQEIWSDFSGKRYQFDEHGELALRMPAAGTYDCSVGVTVSVDGRSFRGGTVVLEPNPRITVLAGDTEQLFEIAISEEAVQAAIQKALK
jgi:hypothetical protein